ncbi:DUF86 domain-containing protein [Neisseria dentiae]|uniref:HepT-like ribonuclease domain-containing protein n=1 Tax=Neisseria dentiae TaxID=194197 RepID=UPI00359F8F86
MNIDRKQDYLSHIRKAAQNAIDFNQDLLLSDFLADERTQQATVMSLLIIGEAATKLINDYPEFTEANAHIPWRSMRGMRNRIAHGYFDIDWAVVWETVRTALPDLLDKLADVRM